MTQQRMTNFRTSSNKYGNHRAVVDGINFASRREANRYSELRLLERTGAIKNLQTQVRFPLEVNGTIVTHYVADFVYDEKGEGVVEDAKGWATDVFKLKAKIFKAIYGKEIRLS